MNKGFAGKIFLSIILLTMGFLVGSISTKISFASKTIEYIAIDSAFIWGADDVESNLKKLGSEGWEYVGGIPIKNGYTRAVFKR
jgi:hypothetical protein